MGNWAIIITGTGQHHNKSDEDVEAITQKFVDALFTANHRITSASVTTGVREEIAVTPTTNEDYDAMKAENSNG